MYLEKESFQLSIVLFEIHTFLTIVLQHSWILIVGIIWWKVVQAAWHVWSLKQEVK